MNGLDAILNAAQDLRGNASISAAMDAIAPAQAPQPVLQGAPAVPQAPVPSASMSMPSASTVSPPASSGLDLDPETRLALLSRLDALKASLLSTPTLDPEVINEISSISTLINPEATGVPLP